MILRALNLPVYPLLWRSPRWLWQFLSWGAATLCAPSALFGYEAQLAVGRSNESPLVWWVLLAIVPLINIVASVCINRRHRWQPFLGRVPLALRYFGTCMVVGTLLYLLPIGSMVVPAFFNGLKPARGDWSVGIVLLLTFLSVLTTVALAIFASLASFTHAGVLHAWLAFRKGALASPVA